MKKTQIIKNIYKTSKSKHAVMTNIIKSFEKPTRENIIERLDDIILYAQRRNNIASIILGISTVIACVYMIIVKCACITSTNLLLESAAMVAIVFLATAHFYHASFTKYMVISNAQYIAINIA